MAKDPKDLSDLPPPLTGATKSGTIPAIPTNPEAPAIPAVPGNAAEGMVRGDVYTDGPFKGYVVLNKVDGVVTLLQYGRITVSPEQARKALAEGWTEALLRSDGNVEIERRT